MDPCSFVRILVGNLALKFPDSSSKQHSPSKIHSCKIKLKSFPDELPTVTFVLPEQQTLNPDLFSNNCISVAACFSLNKGQINRLVVKRGSENRTPDLSIKVYSGGSDCASSRCMVTGCKKLLGKVYVPVDFRGAECKTSVVVHNGWVSLRERRKGSCCCCCSSSSSSSPELHMSVMVEPDPRFVFRFGGEPECSPQVFQVKGSHEQAVFTCTFGFRNSGDRNSLSRTSISKQNSSGKWYISLKSDEDKRLKKERKGWSITIHDLSGSPVAMASMVTPFVPSPGSNRVTQSNPGAWLILRPGGGTWRPWGRLEAWREPHSNTLGYNFEFFHDKTLSITNTTTITTSNVTIKNGGKFTIDSNNNHTTPFTSPHGSGDFGTLSISDSRHGSRTGSESGSDIGFLQPTKYKGFVMSSTMNGVGMCSKPEVEVGVQHVTCTEDAAAFVALAAAIDLSMDACRLFSHKLRKELKQPSQKFVL